MRSNSQARQVRATSDRGWGSWACEAPCDADEVCVCVCVLRLVGAQCTCHCRCQAGHAVSYYGSAAVPATSWTSSWDDWDYAAPRRRWADLRDEEGDGDAARRRGLLAAPLASLPLLVTASEFPKKLDESQGVAWVVLALGMLTRPRGFRSLHF